MENQSLSSKATFVMPFSLHFVLQFSTMVGDMSSPRTLFTFPERAKQWSPLPHPISMTVVPLSGLPMESMSSRNIPSVGMSAVPIRSPMEFQRFT